MGVACNCKGRVELHGMFAVFAAQQFVGFCDVSIVNQSR